MGWAGLCDQVHVALVQGNCSPPQGQVEVVAYLRISSNALIPVIVGSLDCGAEAVAAPVGHPSDLGLDVGPNPFSGITGISCVIDPDRETTLTVFDATGRRVRALYAGVGQGLARLLEWNGRDQYGRNVISGERLSGSAKTPPSTVERNRLRWRARSHSMESRGGPETSSRPEAAQPAGLSRRGW